MYGVKRLDDGAWYGPGHYGRSFGFDGLRASLFDSPGKAKAVINRYANNLGPAKYVVMVVDLDAAMPLP